MAYSKWKLLAVSTDTVETHVKSAIEQFGLDTSCEFRNIMYTTGTVIAGGFLTHIAKDMIDNSKPTPIPPDSDIDFWISVPEMSFTSSSEEGMAIHTHRAYVSSILFYWETYLAKYGYTPRCSNDSYETFKGHGEISMKVISFTHPTIPRKIQIIFGNKTTKDIVGQFDISILRHILYCGSIPEKNPMIYIESTEEALESLHTRTFTSKQDNPERIEKYKKRYGFEFRNSTTTTSQTTASHSSSFTT